MNPSLENALPALTARDVCQMLREVVFGRKTMMKVHPQSWHEVYAGHFIIDVGDWRITLYNDCDELDYCEACACTDGRGWSFDPGARYGTDPVALLSTWEHRQLEGLLKKL